MLDFSRPKLSDLFLCAGFLSVDQTDHTPSKPWLDRQPKEHAGELGITFSVHLSFLTLWAVCIMNIGGAELQGTSGLTLAFDTVPFWWHLFNLVIPLQVLVCMCCTFIPTRKYLRYLRFHLKRSVAHYVECRFLTHSTDAPTRTRSELGLNISPSPSLLSIGRGVMGWVTSRKMISSERGLGTALQSTIRAVYLKYAQSKFACFEIDFIIICDYYLLFF